ncbi:MAG: endonuclease/exonuclease/phosphatase family protein [Crocinitomicaceae bacterium]
MKFTLLILVAFFTAPIVYSQSTDTVSVMAYNLLKFPQENASRITILKNILQESLPDVLMVCELTSSSGANAVLNDALNQDGVSYYEKSTYTPGTDTENMLYYNSNKLALYEENIISTDLRDINEYVLFYKSDDLATTADTTFFYMYMCHLKAGTGDATLRNEMATDLKEYMATRTNLENVVLGGDFNIYGSSEPTWQTVLSGEGVNLVDPINTPGEWHADWGYADIHTQSTRTASIDNGATGGLDDRFDIIFISPDLENWGNQARYIDGTYWAYGQDGNHYNDALTDAPANTSLPTSIIQDLHDMSDHLPVYMEIEVQKSFNGIVEEENKIGVYYNSDDDLIKFTFSKNLQEIGEFEIYNLAGQLVFKGKVPFGESEVSTSEIQEGMYIFKSLKYGLNLKFIK